MSEREREAGRQDQGIRTRASTTSVNASLSTPPRGGYGPQGSTCPPSESGACCPTRHRLAGSITFPGPGRRRSEGGSPIRRLASYIWFLQREAALASAIGRSPRRPSTMSATSR
jgi:hypothetical protein